MAGIRDRRLCVIDLEHALVRRILATPANQERFKLRVEGNRETGFRFVAKGCDLFALPIDIALPERGCFRFT